MKAVFGVAALAFQGDLPASIIHLQRITSDIADWGATSEVVAIFHTDAGHVTLHDTAYNAERHIGTGNPYKELIAGLMSRACTLSCAARPRESTTGGMRICSLGSRSTPMPGPG